MTASNECSEPNPDGRAPCCRPLGHHVLTEHWNGTDSWPHQPGPTSPSGTPADERRGLTLRQAAVEAILIREQDTAFSVVARQIDALYTDAIARAAAPVDGPVLDELREMEATYGPQAFAAVCVNYVRRHVLAPAAPSPAPLDVRKLPEWEALREAAKRWDEAFGLDRQRGAMGDTALAGVRLLAAADREEPTS